MRPLKENAIDKALTKAAVLLIFQMLMAFSTAYCQGILTGKVTGKDGVALSGASISVIGTSNVTITDASGRYSLKADPGALIEFSYVGYASFQIVLRNETELNIPLVEGSVLLNEVVVVGYGTTLRKDVTGAVASVSEKDFIRGNITSPLEQVQGKVPGLYIVQPGGDPNGDFIVRIRGATSLEGQQPLLVIDGVAIDDFNRAITTLNPSDVASFDILKDAAAAAIYGSRGANGVILITTKKGKAGKTIVEYSGFTTAEMISNSLKVLNADQWRSASASDPSAQNYDLGANTDWLKEVSRVAYSQNHTLGISGGTDQLNFRGSVGYIKQEGIIGTTGKEVFTGRLAVEQKSMEGKLQIRYGLNVSVIDRNFLPDQTSTSQVRQGGSFFFGTTPGPLPVWPVYNPDGSYASYPNGGFSPVWIINNAHSKQRQNFFQASVKADYEILNGLKVGVLGALSRGNDMYDRFWAAPPNGQGVADATKSNNNKENFTGDIHFNYQKSFDKHSINVTGVYEYNKFVNDGFSVTARGFVIPELLYNNLGAASNVTTQDISSFKNEVRIISFLGRFIYNYDDRYILTANFRRDGSSKFGTNNQWGNFPSIALAWRMSNESFLRDVTWLKLKMRGSFGYTGNQENLPPNSYQLLYAPSGPYLYNKQFKQSYAVTQEYNPDLKWEVRQSFNIGMDFSLWGDRLNGSIDVFDDKTSDMLFNYNIPTPPFVTNSVYANAANAVNKGFEISLGALVIRKDKFSWNILANLGSVRNRITGLLGQFRGTDLFINNQSYGEARGGALGSAPVTQLQVGYPAGVFWIPEHTGFDNQGRELFNKYSPEGKLIGTDITYTNQDRVYIDPTPNYSWGITNSFTFGNFDASLFFRGVQGQKIYANSLMNYETKALFPGINVVGSAFTSGFTQLAQPSTYWLRDGSYARLENVTLGYNFENLKGFSRLRIYMVARNLLVITSYGGIDPEINTDGSQRYIDSLYYPKTRGLTVGIDIGF